MAMTLTSIRMHARRVELNAVLPDPTLLPEGRKAPVEVEAT